MTTGNENVKLLDEMTTEVEDTKLLDEMTTRKENLKLLEMKIKELEGNVGLKKEISLSELTEIKNELNNICEEDINISLRTSIYKLRGRLAKIKKSVYNLNNPKGFKLTKWEVFMRDISELEGFDDLKALVNLVEEKRSDINMSQEEFNGMEELYSECLMEIHTKMQPYDRDVIVKELNKKMRLFNNRINRVVENGFGEWIKNLRCEKGYSLKELESISTVTASYIHRLERGEKKTPSVPVIEKLAIALGINPKEFFTKLNIINDEPVELENLLQNEDILINGEKITKVQRNAIVSMMNTIMNTSSEEKILQTVSKFKGTIKNTNNDVEDMNNETVAITVN